MKPRISKILILNLSDIVILLDLETFTRDLKSIEKNGFVMSKKISKNEADELQNFKITEVIFEEEKTKLKPNVYEEDRENFDTEHKKFYIIIEKIEREARESVARELSNHSKVQYFSATNKLVEDDNPNLSSIIKKNEKFPIFSTTLDQKNISEKANQNSLRTENKDNSKTPEREKFVSKTNHGQRIATSQNSIRKEENLHSRSTRKYPENEALKRHLAEKHSGFYSKKENKFIGNSLQTPQYSHERYGMEEDNVFDETTKIRSSSQIVLPKNHFCKFCDKYMHPECFDNFHRKL